MKGRASLSAVFTQKLGCTMYNSISCLRSLGRGEGGGEEGGGGRGGRRGEGGRGEGRGYSQEPFDPRSSIMYIKTIELLTTSRNFSMCAKDYHRSKIPQHTCRLYLNYSLTYTNSTGVRGGPWTLVL